jgi:hypothetical protein
LFHFLNRKSSTDTIAVNPDNTPFREKDGSLLFRPAGHGALLENLGQLDADIIFIKNIDNVVPDRIKKDTITYKKAHGRNCFTISKTNFWLFWLNWKKKRIPHYWRNWTPFSKTNCV